MRLRYLLGLLLLIGLLGGISRPAAAATTKSAFGVSPALQNLVATAQASTMSYQISVTNNSAQPLEFTASTTDFTALGLNGGLAFISAQQAGNHSLAQSLSLSSNVFTVPAHQSRQVTVSISNVQKLRGGGHYGAVLLRAGPVTGSTTSQVSLRQSVASLVFLSTAGQGTYNLKLLPVNQSIAWFSLPSSFNLVLANDGNVQTSPRGYINLSGPFHRQIARGIINANSGLVLPGTKRLLQTTTTLIHHAFWPGIYTLNVYYRADGASKFTLASSHFLYLNLWFLLVLIVAILVIIFVFKHAVSKNNKMAPKRS